MTINLKIEIIKILTIEFSLSSGKEPKLKKDEPNEEADSTQPDDGKHADSGK